MDEYTTQDVQQALEESRAEAKNVVADYLAPNAPADVKNALKEIIGACFDDAANEAGMIAAELNTAMHESGAMTEASNGEPVTADGGFLDISDVISALKTVFQANVEAIAGTTGLTEAQATIAIAGCVAVMAALMVGFHFGREFERKAEEQGIISGAVDKYLN